MTYIHVFFHFSIRHSTSLHTPLFLGPARCKSRVHHVSHVSTLQCKRLQLYSKPESPSLEKDTCIRTSCDSVRGDVMGLTMLLVTQPLSCIFVSTGGENRALQQTLLWVEIHQCGGCLELFRRLHKWPPWGSLHPHHVTITPYIVNSRQQKVTNLCTPFYGLAQVCKWANHYVIKYEWC